MRTQVETLHRLLGCRRGLVAGLLFAALSGGCESPRATAAEFERIVEVLQLKADMMVADVGAGNGRWAVQLARFVGKDGRVWATEIGEKEIEEIEGRVRSEKLKNVTVVLGDPSDSGLPEGCCDAILLRMVYHHFTQPEAMRASLRRALRPAGLIAIIDIVPQTSWRQLPGVPERGGHGISAEALIAEMTVEGFRLLSREDHWSGDEDRYCVVFRR